MDADTILRIKPALTQYLHEFDGCFGRITARQHLDTYVQGQLGDQLRKSVEPMADAAGIPPRNLQEFLSLYRWDESAMRDQLQQLVARRHAHLHSVGILDETSFVKKGRQTACVQRQHCGVVGKTENCVVSVHLGYATPDFHALLDGELYLPEETWHDDRRRCRAAGIPEDVVYRPKWQIGLEEIRRARGNGIRLAWMTFDEGYGGKPPFLRALDELGQNYVGEVPVSFTAWTKPPLPDRLSRARHLLAAARTQAALEEIDSLDLEVGEAPLLAVLRAMAMLQAGRPAEAERLASPVARLPGPGEPAAARFVMARATARQGRLDESIGWYRRVAAERPIVPGLSASQQADLADDAAFLVAWLPYDAGRFAESVVPLRRFARDHPHARRAPDARWFSAWALLRAGDRPAARAAFRTLASREIGILRSAALYWQGRLESDPKRSSPLYRDAILEAPEGWYALLSSARLAANGDASLPTAPLPPTALPDPPRDRRLSAAMVLAVDLAGAGLRAESASLLQRLSRASDARGSASLIAEVAAFTGDPEVPFRMARDHLPPGIRARHWSYPDAHADVLPEAARKMGLDPALALAVMRRESAFVAAARSGAAAEGVLQLRPETARRLQAILGVTGAANLSDPAENLRFGIAYLALLGDRFGEPAAALAAYNAGPTAAATWARAGAGLPLDEWVEGIPFRETRQYVRSVMADRAVYRTLLGQPPLPVDPSSPISPPGPGIAF